MTMRTYEQAVFGSMLNWQEYFRQIAHTVKLKSKDRDTQIGAVVVGKDNEIVSTGYNSFPRGIVDYDYSRQERPEKYYFMEHAERNAIYNAALIGVSTKGCTMYLTCGVPCADCTRGIINAGIKKIVIEPNEIHHPKSELWIEHTKRSRIMCEEANIEIVYYGEE
jgi:dCMP deaminase